MSYCGICNKHDIATAMVEGGFYCSGCDEIHYYVDLNRENVKRTLLAAKLGKSEGWKFYPNIEGFGNPIDEVISEYENKAKVLGIY